MALDTRDRRAAAIGVGSNFNRLYPNPDTDLNNFNDRAQMALSYQLMVVVSPFSNVELLFALCAPDVRVFRWSGVTENIPAEPVTINGGLPISMTVEGNFGAGGEVTLEGHNALLGNFFVFPTITPLTSDGITGVEETALQVRPTVPTGANVSVVVHLLVRGGFV